MKSHKFKSLILIAFAVFTLNEQVQADEYKWLKTHEYDNIFVYTDFEECGFIAMDLNRIIRATLSRSKIKATIINGGEIVRRVAVEKCKS